MKKIIIPSKKYFNQAYKIIKNVSKFNEEPYNIFYHMIYKLFYKTPKLDQLVFNQTKQGKFKISDGTSDYKTFKPYIQQLIRDFKNHTYYRSYNGSLGNIEARQSVAYMENVKFKKNIYSFQNVALTEGSTGAISQIFEFIKRKYPRSEIIIGSPTYYIYEYSAKFYNLKFIEALGIKKMNDRITSFDPIPDILNKINKNIKLIVLTLPANPSSQVYKKKELRTLIYECKKNNILLLIDELFSDLIYQDNFFVQTDTIANKIDALDNLVIVKGFSKSKNLAGLRIGYLVSKNKILIEEITKISEQRQCFTSSSCFTGLISLDCFIQSIRQAISDYQDLNLLTNNLKNDFDKFSSTIRSYSCSDLTKIYFKYKKYSIKLKNYYSQYYDEVILILNQNIESATPKITAFNTFIKIKDLDSVNFFDFCVNFYLTCNIVTQIGPCFAFDQKRWENDDTLGFWLRISYARENKKLFIKSLQLFNEFKNLYLKYPSKFLKTNLSF